ncbi:MAG: FAD-dependent oxidoreductase [Nitrososphaerota archaeon]|nr:FAD-dependent oxidoreductase [Nitrososphaerota archaeon]MDG7019842.1 FAD-dependent oxidoreductase [Nitrososphaerota archaeon]
MPKVVVVGAGMAGMEAAREALGRGADVTVVDQSERVEPPWRAWPDLIGVAPWSGPSGASASHESEVPVELGTKVVSVGPDQATTASGATLRADATVVVTGTSNGSPGIHGIGKRGSYFLDAAYKYEQLGRSVSDSGRVVVAGEGVRGLEVAERLATGGRKVMLIASCWASGAPGADAMAAIATGASERGVSLRAGRASRVVGQGKVEAMVADGEVVPCDTFVQVPVRRPRVVSLPARLGRSGGIVVDAFLRTESKTVYAAGGCAEPPGWSSPGGILGSPAASGRVAGANAMGGEVRFHPGRSFSSVIFGLSWFRHGPPIATLRARGGLVTVTSKRDTCSVCGIAYDRRGRVVSVETVGKFSPDPGALPWSIPEGSTLASLAYGPLGSTDISLVSDTARLGLKSWSGY